MYTHDVIFLLHVLLCLSVCEVLLCAEDYETKNKNKMDEKDKQRMWEAGTT